MREVTAIAGRIIEAGRERWLLLILAPYSFAGLAGGLSNGPRMVMVLHSAGCNLPIESRGPQRRK